MRRRVLLVNLDFRDFVYSYLWGRAVVDGCARRNFAVDLVAVNPFAGRDLAAELGVSPSALDIHIGGTAVYLDNPDESQARSATGRLLDRQHYDAVILNCDASLFIHLMVDREKDLAHALWLVYDRHLHLDLPAHRGDAHLRDRMIGSGMHLFAIREIATGSVPPPDGYREGHTGLIRTFRRLGLTPESLHLQLWPLDDEFFAPQPEAAPADGFTIFSGGDSGRDYATLFEAIRGLPVQLRLCASNYPAPVPPNVTVLPRLLLYQFRDEVARATAVVVPLAGHPPVCGITVIAMAKMLGKAVIASDNPVVRMHIRSHGDGGYLAPLHDAAALRALLVRLVESPAERERLGREARAQAARDLSLKAFVERMFAVFPERPQD